MMRWTVVIVLSSCTITPVLAQATKPTDSAAQAHASEPSSNAKAAAGKAEPSVNVYPLDSFPDFSGLMMGSRAEPGEGASRGHIYRSGNRLRMDDPEGGSGYFVTDLNTGETYGILEANCIHDSHPYIRAIPFHFAGKVDATVTRTPAGKESVDGHSCQVEDITLSSPMLSGPQKMRFWEAEDQQGFPIKIEFVLPGGHGPIIRYKDVVLGRQDPALFSHPKSCQGLPQVPTAGPRAKKPPAQ